MKRNPHYLFTISFFLLSVISRSQNTDLNPLDYFAQSEIDQANTAKGIDYLTDEEKGVYLYTNLVRLYPKKFYELYRDFAIAEKKEELLLSSDYYTTLTETLKNGNAVSAVYPDEEMFELAKCWALESGKKGLTGHDRKECPKGYDGENCAYGYFTAQVMVMQLLIDYGVSSLGHRKNLLHPEWNGLGVAIRPHKDIEICVVQDFSRTNDLMKEDARKRDQLIVTREEDFAQIMEQWDKEELKEADVNRNAKYLNDLEKDFYFYINLMRLNPKKFKEVIWDQGPFFDQLPAELEKGVRTEDQYKVVSEWLESANKQETLIPNKKTIAGLKCIIERFLDGQTSFSGCVKCGSWQFATYQTESNFNDIMNILLTPKDFQSISQENAIAALMSGETGIKVILKED